MVGYGVRRRRSGNGVSGDKNAAARSETARRAQGQSDALRSGGTKTGRARAAEGGMVIERGASGGRVT